MFHVCEEGRRQSSFLCPRGTIFNQVWQSTQTPMARVNTFLQEFRVCDWWYNVKCENSAEYFDRNLDIMIQVGGHTGRCNGLIWLISPGSKEGFGVLIIIFPWSGLGKSDWRWAKPWALLLQGGFNSNTKSDIYPGWLWLARFRTRFYRHKLWYINMINLLSLSFPSLYAYMNLITQYNLQCRNY